jgi:hypothetical protein
MDEPVQVEAALDDDQRLTPRAFIWRGETRQVHQVGRRWDDGPWQHNLVMTADGHTWDLAYAPELAVWHIKLHLAPRDTSLI